LRCGSIKPILIPKPLCRTSKNLRRSEKYGFRGICVNPQWVAAAKAELGDFPAKVICLVDAPIGDSSHEERMQICLTAKNNGADELDAVAALPDIKHERWQEVYKDLAAICKILPTKVIIGSGYLTDKEIAMVSRLVKQAGAICVKTATSKDPLEERELKEKAWHLEIMKKNAPGLLIKAYRQYKGCKGGESLCPRRSRYYRYIKRTEDREKRMMRQCKIEKSKWKMTMQN